MSMSIFCVHNTNQSMANCFEDIFKSKPCILTVLISLFGNFFPTDKGFSLTSLVGNAQWYFEKKINKKVHKKSSLHLLNAPRFPVKSHASNWYKNITFSNIEMINSFRLLLFWGLLYPWHCMRQIIHGNTLKISSRDIFQHYHFVNFIENDLFT